VSILAQAVFGVLTAAWVVYAVACISDTGVGFIEAMFGGLAAAFLAVLWPMAWATRSAWGWLRTYRLLVWSLFPILGLSLLVIYFQRQSPANPLFQLRYLASQASLTRAAEALRDGTSTDEPQRAGLFAIHFVRVDAPTEVVFLTADCGVVDQCGLAYRPGPPPASWRYWHVRGAWYLLYEPF
jgi:hypothetical protein